MSLQAVRVVTARHSIAWLLAALCCVSHDIKSATKNTYWDTAVPITTVLKRENMKPPYGENMKPETNTFDKYAHC